MVKHRKTRSMLEPTAVHQNAAGLALVPGDVNGASVIDLGRLEERRLCHNVMAALPSFLVELLDKSLPFKVLALLGLLQTMMRFLQ